MDYAYIQAVSKGRRDYMIRESQQNYVKFGLKIKLENVQYVLGKINRSNLGKL